MMERPMPDHARDSLVLHHFVTSHFNEKVRWALDWKGLPHERVGHLPGPHMPTIRRMTGQTATPVLVRDGEVVAGSATIIDALETLHPEPALYPADPGERARALEIQREFDEGVGAAVRTAVFSVMIVEPDFLCRMFSQHRGAVGRRLYRATFPFAKRLMARAHETDQPERVERAFEVSRQALDRVAKEVGPSGQLVGDGFSVADLTCAALLAPLVETGHPDMARPEPVPASVEAFVARWADHEGAHWVRDQYARHRPSGSPAPGA